MPSSPQPKYRNLILIGCGPHYRKRYHSVLEAAGVNILLLIDLQSQKEKILHFFENKTLSPSNTLFLDESFRNTISIDQIETLLTPFQLSQADAVLLCTEPKARKSYALWALQHNLPLFMDKPPCAFPHAEKRECLILDYNEILNASNHANLTTVVSCERRAHPGYLWLFNYLKEFTQTEKTSITSINIHFANGHWVTPLEYCHQEYHPFKYGYGLLLHSGYHYIDLLSSLIQLNQNKNITYNLKTISTHPEESISTINRNPPLQNEPTSFGETSVLLIGQAKAEGKLISNFSVHLENTSVSKRISLEPSPEAEWRMKQEQIVIHLDYLASIHITSHPFKKIDPDDYPLEDFNITIIHSPLLKHRKPIIKMSREDIANISPSLEKTGSLNQQAREWQLREFLHGRDGNSLLLSHKNTVNLLNLIYSEIHATNHTSLAIHSS